MFEDLLNSLNPFKKKIDVAPFEITCIIDGKNFNLWTNAEITIPFDGVSHFSISCPFDYNQKSFRDLFRPFTYKEIELYVNGDLKLTGYFITPKPAGSESSATMTIDGYGKCGILQDVPADPESWPVSFNGLTLPQIIDKLGDPYGIKCNIIEPQALLQVATPFAGSEMVAIEFEEKIWDFLTKLSKQRGVYLTDDYDGNVLIHTTLTESAVTKIDDSIASIDVNYNGQEMPSVVYAVAASMAGVGNKNKINNPVLTDIYRPHIRERSDSSGGSLLTVAKAELGRKIAASVDIKVTVPSWLDPSGNMYLENSTISMMSPKNMLYKWHNYFIKNIVYKKNENDMNCEMTLCFPECYNGQILSDFPWQEVFPAVPESPLSLLDKIKAATTI